MKRRILFIILTLTIFFVGCGRVNMQSDNDFDVVNDFESEFFEEIFISTEEFELTVESDSEFLENENIEFVSTLKYIGTETVEFQGGHNKVTMYILDEDGNSMHNIAYHDLGFSKKIKSGEEFVEEFSFTGLEAGEYYLYVQTSWISLDGEYHHGVGYEKILEDYEERKHLGSKDLTDLFKSKIVIDRHKITIRSKK